jgi:hypothetical protein
VRRRTFASAAGLLAVTAIALSASDRVITWSWSEVLRISPWILLTLAVVNVLRATVPTGALLGPTVLSLGALLAALMQRPPLAGPSSRQVVVVVLSLAAIALLHRATSGRGRTWAVWWITRRSADKASSRESIVAIFGVAVVDLSDATAWSPTEILCVVLFGRIELAVPDTWAIRASPSVVSRWTQVRDEGASPPELEDASFVTFRLFGLGGSIRLTRVNT